MQVTELLVILSTFMSEERSDGIELCFGLEPVSCDFNLILATVDEIWCYHLFFSGVLRKIVHKSQTNMTLQCIAIGTTSDLANILTISVNGLSPPRPEVQVCVVVIQNEHD